MFFLTSRQCFSDKREESLVVMANVGGALLIVRVMGYRRFSMRNPSPTRLRSWTVLIGCLL